MIPTALFHEFGTRGKVSFKAAGARYTVNKTKAAREGFEKSSRQGGGVPARPILVWSRARLATRLEAALSGTRS